MAPLWTVPPVPAQAGPPAARHDVVIVGAGITGLVTGLLLARDGVDVAILEQDEVAARTTGAATGKLTLLQGAALSQLRAGHSASLVRAYVEANRAGQEWVRQFADDAGVPYARRTAYSYAQTATGAARLAAESAAALEAGLPVRTIAAQNREETPFPVAAAIALEDQMALDPAALAAALAQAFLAAGGALHLGTRVTGVRLTPNPHVRTPAGAVSAGHIVLATGTPILNRGLTFLKVAPTRVHAVALRWPGPLPLGLYLSVDGPRRSVRAVTEQDGPAETAQLVVAGAAHPVGQPGDGGQSLVHWAQYHFPDAEPVSRWAAQDYRSHNLVPFAGALPRGAGRIRFATGFGSWGLTNGPAAAQRIAAEIRGVPWRSRPAWIRVIATRTTVPEDLRRGARENARVARAALAGWAGAGRRRTPVPEPAEGTGVIALRHGAPVGISRVAGVTRGVGAVCPHLGGVVRWNEVECTWDCPLHGSRFTPEGRRIEGPARADLPALNRAAPAGHTRAR